jgi:hypothetical protein
MVSVDTLSRDTIPLINLHIALLQMLMEILAVMENFPFNNCEVSFNAWKKVFIKCMVILQCHVGYFPENIEDLENLPA